MSEACHRRTTCRLCGGENPALALSLTPTPPANAFVAAERLDEPQETFPLDVFFCEDCAHVQLLDVVDPRILFENYVYVSGTSPVFVRHFEGYAGQILARYSPPGGSLAVDIGSNDGTLLRFFKDAGLKVQGVDPAKDIAARATKDGIDTIAGFFTPELADRICRQKGPAAVIAANNVFAHADDLAGIVEGVRRLLAPGGVFVFEVSYLVDVLEKTLFDTIYHEHLAYHSVGPLMRFFAANGMEITDAARVDSHGGSLRCVVQHRGGPHPVDASVARLVALEESLGLHRVQALKDFAARVDRLKEELSSLLRRLKAEGKSIAGFGAPAKATTLMYHFAIGPGLLDFIVDDSPLKQGLYSPGMHIPVVPSTAIEDNKPDYLIILAWNFAPSIMEKHASFRQSGGHFIVPLPTLEIH